MRKRQYLSFRLYMSLYKMLVGLVEGKLGLHLEEFLLVKAKGKENCSK